MFYKVLAKSYELKMKAQDMFNDQRGVTAVEYAIIAVAMSAIILVVFKTGGFKEALDAAVKSVKTNIGSANTP
ncbi:Flp family type IVb pilin [Vibrio mimicus]|uniref:Flp family type IVb pilin n=1 Tax=Vibrio mimicus TaxID=674 RepID=UPI000878B15A|nr:Flp family type IVb pilin [Vibrio mimicus]AOW84349.1 pilus assembly protein [Vibrio mimicus]